MNLLLITDGENKHYVLIKDFNRFMYNQTKYERRKHFCVYCLQCFSSEKILNKHKTNCIVINGEQVIKMPDEGETVKFINHHKLIQVSFVIYADFEGITEKVQGCKPNNDKSYTESYQNHKDCSYGYKVVCYYDDKYTKTVQVYIYRGENAVYKFMGKKTLYEVNYCKKIIKNNVSKPLRMTAKDEENFKKADDCHICGKKYIAKDIRVRDHCHMTGK